MLESRRLVLLRSQFVAILGAVLDLRLLLHRDIQVGVELHDVRQVASCVLRLQPRYLAGLGPVGIPGRGVVHLLDLVENHFVDLSGVGIAVGGDSIDQIQVLDGLLALDDDLQHRSSRVVEGLLGARASSLVGRVDLRNVGRVVPLRFGYAGLLDVELVEGLVEVRLLDDREALLKAPRFLFLAFFLLRRG